MSFGVSKICARAGFVALRTASVLALLFLGACQNAPTANRSIVYTAASPELSRASIDTTTHTWQSSPWDGPWIGYPGQAEVQLEHGLGRVPKVILVYLSFQPDGHAPALAAGDLARFLDATDTTLTVWNTTNQNYYFRVVAY